MLAVRVPIATEACVVVTKTSSTATETRPIGPEGAVRIGGSATLAVRTITYLLDALLNKLLGVLYIRTVLDDWYMCTRIRKEC